LQLRIRKTINDKLINAKRKRGGVGRGKKRFFD